ncbi:hypothetical protein GQ600_16646 [Phytophthora cactorum]|nr:hypothetical protein GQ600_16646 [Phytophthora cactorum]
MSVNASFRWRSLCSLIYGRGCLQPGSKWSCVYSTIATRGT